MRISDWSSDVCSSDLRGGDCSLWCFGVQAVAPTVWLTTLWEQAMKKLLIAGALVAIAFSGSAFADDDDDDRGREARKEYQEARREALKDHREAIREYEKDRREYEKERREDMREAAKDRREAEREYWKDRREAEREWRKDAREYRRWARGEYIPRHYPADRYSMQDYRSHD